MRWAARLGRALERILEKVDGQSSVLDIGAGSGALTIPIARLAKHVIAVEPSRGQIERLQEEAEAAGVNNITIIPERWEDVSPDEIGSCDIVTAGYCFQMEDINGALAKMCHAARSHVYLLHFVEYGVLGFLFARALIFEFPREARVPLSRLFLAVALSTLYGITDELHQYFVPGRYCSGADMMADFIGSLAGVTAAWGYRNVRFRYKQGGERI